ncbi:hypothetical protein GCM10028825_47450 [Spirosoma agri]
MAPWLVQAQAVTFQHSVKVAVEAVHSIDNDRQTPTLKYSVGYTRQLTSGRWMLEGSLGYINYFEREELSAFYYTFKGGRSQRFVADFLLHVNLLKSRRHALRLGAGPSVWYQRNSLVNDLSIELAPGYQDITSVSFTRGYLHTANLGLNLRGEYEVAITPRINVGARAGLVSNLLPANGREPLLGTLATVGLSAGYRF